MFSGSENVKRNLILCNLNNLIIKIIDGMTSVVIFVFSDASAALHCCLHIVFIE